MIQHFITKRKTKSLLPIIFVSGSFELLHPGHISLLEAAAEIPLQEDVPISMPLVVGVNSNHSIHQYKPYKLASRPITPEKSRARIVASLGCVDYVFIFDEPTTTTNIETLKPTYFVKGVDYTEEQLNSVEVSTAKNLGTKIRLVGETSPYDTTEIIKNILEGQRGRKDIQ